MGQGHRAANEEPEASGLSPSAPSLSTRGPHRRRARLVGSVADCNVCFAGTNYRVGSKFRRRQVQVAVLGDTVEISLGEQLIRSHAVKHDRTRQVPR
jgi:hypothetical protein